jgi:hypothetical protein
MIGRSQGPIVRPGPTTPGVTRLRSVPPLGGDVVINYINAVGTSYAASWDTAPATAAPQARARDYSEAFDSGKAISTAQTRGREWSTPEERAPSRTAATTRGLSEVAARDFPASVCCPQAHGLSESVGRSSAAFSFMLAQTHGRPFVIATDRIKPGALSGFRGLERAVARAVARPLVDAQTRAREDTASSSRLGGAVINAATRGRSASATRDQVRAMALATAYARSVVVDWAKEGAVTFVHANANSITGERSSGRVLMLAGMKAESVAPAETSLASRALSSIRGSDRTAAADSEVASAAPIVVGLSRVASWDKSVITSTAALRANDFAVEYASTRTRATAGVNVMAITIDSAKARASSFSGVVGGEVVSAYDRGSMIGTAQLHGRTFTCIVCTAFIPALSISATALIKVGPAAEHRVRIGPAALAEVTIGPAASARVRIN